MTHTKSGRPTYIMFNNHLSSYAPKIFSYAIGWVDQFTNGRPHVSRFFTHNKNDLYWRLNQTEIVIQDMNEKTGQIHIQLKTNTPHFSGFLVKIENIDQKNNSHMSPWEVRRGSLIWGLQAGENIFHVRAVNVFGVKGKAAKLKVLYKP